MTPLCTNTQEQRICAKLYAELWCGRKVRLLSNRGMVKNGMGVTTALVSSKREVVVGESHLLCQQKNEEKDFPIVYETPHALDGSSHLQEPRQRVSSNGLRSNFWHIYDPLSLPHFAFRLFFAGEIPSADRRRHLPYLSPFLRCMTELFSYN